MSKTNVNEVLKEGGRGMGSGGIRARRWTGALIVVNLALTLVLLAGAGFMMRSFMAMYRLDLGIDTSRLLTMQMALSYRKYSTSDERNAFIKRVDERLAANRRVRVGGHHQQFSARRRPRHSAHDRWPDETG